MIDIKAIKAQLKAYMEIRTSKDQWIREQLDLIEKSFYQAGQDADNWQAIIKTFKQEGSGRKPLFLAAQISSNPAEFFPLNPAEGAYQCFAADGSQMMPSRHELPDLALIQIGQVAIGYRVDIRPQLLQKSCLITSADLETSLKNPTERPTFDQFVSDERSIREMEDLALLCAPSSEECPGIALVDGTLILWNLSDRSQDWRKLLLDRMGEAFFRFMEKKIPLVGYISRPGSREIINTLALYDYHQKKGTLPRDTGDLFFESETGKPTLYGSGITDRMLFSRLLEPGYRSAWFLSGSHILQEYSSENRVLFCYLRTQEEIVRLEIPEWATLYEEQIHSLVWDQCRKGKGYPITLSEAHEQAVIRGPDRELFYRMAYEELRRIKKTGRRSLPQPSQKQKRKIRPVI